MKHTNIFQIFLSAALLSLLSACKQSDSNNTGPLPQGLWRAALELPGGELPFGLEFVTENGTQIAYLINGIDRVRVAEVQHKGSILILRMPGFENTLEVKVSEDELHGTLTMIKGGGKKQLIPFKAIAGQNWRFSQPNIPKEENQADLTGRWEVTFDDHGKRYAGIGEFSQAGDIVTGTFLTPTGDHRFLAGELQGRDLKLSKFDGGQAFLYHAAIEADGSLKGKFWSGLTSVETFHAKRNINTSLGDAENITHMLPGEKTLDFRFPDLGGTYISLSDSFFKGKVVIVALGGSWCPNCHDEAVVLANLHRNKRDQGLEIISLMFEQFGDFSKAAEATHRFRDRYNIDYTTLIAGISDKDTAAKKIPEINGIFAFPTTVFIDRRGQVRKIHTGFSGPATGSHYKKIVAEFEQLTNTLLAEEKPNLIPTKIIHP